MVILPENPASEGKWCFDKYISRDQAWAKTLSTMKLWTAKHNLWLESDEYRNSSYIQKMRQLDQDRQADGNWNEERRALYAEAVRANENREVREYRSDPIAQAINCNQKTHARVAKARASETVEQTEKRQKRDAESKRLKRAANKAIAASTNV
tara:strand:+ start:12243 stop:12701 length:459 start_codon:yes stop_codon:yes gene_type:complete